jgi:HEAT repeat protein
MIAIIIKSQMTGRTSIKKFNTMDDLRAYVGSQSLPESLIQNEQDLAVAVQNVAKYLSRSHIDAQVVTEDELRRLQETFKALQDKVNTWTNKPEHLLHEDAKYARGGEQELERLNELHKVRDAIEAKVERDTYFGTPERLEKSVSNNPKSDKAIAEQIVKQLGGERGVGSTGVLPTKASLATMFRSYKHTPHQPLSVFLKFLVHRIENKDKYEAATPEQRDAMDADVLKLMQSGKAAEKNAGVSTGQLQNYLQKNPQLITSVLKHQRELHGFLQKHYPLWIKDGKVALTRGLNVPVGEEGPEHPLASYADIQNPPFGTHKHHRKVPLNNIWYSFMLGPKAATSAKWGNENEWLVSPHNIERADQFDVQEAVPREHHSLKEVPGNAIMWQPSVTAETISRILRDGTKDQKILALYHPSATPEHISVAQKDESWNVRRAAIQHPNATPGHISEALKDRTESVRYAAIQHPNATPEHISEALKDQSENVRYAAIHHPNATPGHISEALKDQSYAVRKAAIEHPNATPGHISEALKDQNGAVRIAAIEHPNATPGHISEALKDQDYAVRIAAVRHPNATPGHISEALKDQDSDVRLAAEERLKEMKSEPIAKSDAADLYDQYRPQLEAIAQIESTSHQFREHPLVQKGVHKDTRSISSYGIMPKSAYELAVKDPNFASTATGKAIKQAATPVPNAPAGTEWKNVAEITRDRKHDDAAAAAVWHYQRSRVSKFAPKDANLDAMTAYAHRNGITATFQLINQDNGYQSLLAHPYVSTFLKNLSSQKPTKK